MLAIPLDAGRWIGENGPGGFPEESLIQNQTLEEKKVESWRNARWWQLKYVLFSPLLGEDFQFD